MSVKAAKQEREQAVQEIERLTKRVSDLDAYIRVHSTLRPPAAGEMTRQRDPAAKEAIVNFVASLLEGGKTMKTADIVSELTAGQVPIPGANPEQYVSQLLSRDKKRFKASRKSGWSLQSAINVVQIGRGGT